jgi:hypothetical protein
MQPLLSHVLIVIVNDNLNAHHVLFDDSGTMRCICFIASTVAMSPIHVFITFITSM